MSFLYDSHSSHLEFYNIVHMLPFLEDINVLLILFLHYREKMRIKNKKQKEWSCMPATKLGLTLPCRRKTKRSHLSPLPSKHTETGCLSEHRDEHHPNLPAKLLLVQVLRRHIWTVTPHPSRQHWPLRSCKTEGTAKIEAWIPISAGTGSENTFIQQPATALA